MKNKPLLVLYVLVVILAGAFIFSEVYDSRQDIFGSERQTKYTMYIGMNDKDTQEQTYGLNEAKEVMFMIVRKYTGGCTFYEAQGCWYDEEKKAMVSENTLVCVFLDIEPEAVKSIMDEALKVFNQSSILLETEEVRNVFYSN
ncbi:MAG: DUF3574 domain-containing protein [Synergistaceae bacterium]|nr:DUF3574 domain-containing protein [Synergistaceae bacterium]